MFERHKILLILFVFLLSTCSPTPQPNATEDSSQPLKDTPSPQPVDKPFTDTPTLQPNVNGGTAIQSLVESPTATPDRSAALYITLASPILENGIKLLPVEGDNRYAPIKKGGQDAMTTDGFSSHVRSNYMYFKVDERFGINPGPITVEFDYYDEGEGLIIFQYDSFAVGIPEPHYKPVSAGFLQNTLKWKTESFVVTDARLLHKQRYGADFRFSTESTPLILREIRIKQGGELGMTPTPEPTVFPPANYPGPLGDKAVFTYYFYWYSPLDHIFNMTHAAVDYKTMDWNDVSWHVRQLQDVSEAGIDVILPIYWYAPYDLQWSQPGLKNLAEALEQIRALGITPPAVGLFMDTTSSTGEDLRNESRQAYFYKSLKYFFMTIPRQYWALAEGARPIIWFYTANWPLAYDQSFVNYLYEQFEVDFGVRPYLVFENSWDYPTETLNGIQVKDMNAAHLQYDAGYGWGGAVAPNVSPYIASIGPGYDDHAVEDRIPPTITDRKNGETYKQGFMVAIQCGTPWLAIETWNEYHEGTEIAESLQYGRQYIDLTKEYVSYFKQGILPESARPNLFGNEIVFSAASPNTETGLNIAPSVGDGLYTLLDVSGTLAVRTEPMAPDAEASYLYFLVDNGFYFNEPQPLSLTVTYFDEGYEPVGLDYDAAHCSSPFDVGNMYRRIDLVQRRNTLTWKTVTVRISDATFAGNQNGGTDFRLATGISSLTISELRIEKQP